MVSLIAMNVYAESWGQFDKAIFEQDDLVMEYWKLFISKRNTNIVHFMDITLKISVQI